MIPTEFEPALQALTARFLEENGKINLSAFRTEEQCRIGNVMDSLAVLDVLPKLGAITSIFDLGTGGGFPLLPLAICLPKATCIGLDSMQKKVDAVNRIAKDLQLKNATCIAGRAELLGRDPAYRERFDLLTCRAVAEIPVILEYCSPFVKPGGKIILWKSMNIEEELQNSMRARAEFSLHLAEQCAYELPGDWGKRQLLIFEKTRPLSEKYPREVGVPKKDPLL